MTGVCVSDANSPGTADKPNIGCKPLNPLCRLNGLQTECVCKDDGANSVACETTDANKCNAGTCECGTGSKCTSGSTLPSCLLEDGNAPTDDIDNETPTCKVNHLS